MGGKCDDSEPWKEETEYGTDVYLIQSDSVNKLRTFIQKSPEPPSGLVVPSGVLGQRKGHASCPVHRGSSQRQGPCPETMSLGLLTKNMRAQAGVSRKKIPDLRMNPKGAHKPCDHSQTQLTRRLAPNSLAGQDVCLSSLPTWRTPWKGPFFPLTLMRIHWQGASTVCISFLGKPMPPQMNSLPRHREQLLHISPRRGPVHSGSCENNA